MNPYMYDRMAFQAPPGAPHPQQGQFASVSPQSDPGYQGYPPHAGTQTPFQPMPSSAPSTASWPVTSAGFVPESTLPNVVPPVHVAPIIHTGHHTTATDNAMVASQPGMMSPPVTETCLTDVLDFQFQLPATETEETPAANPTGNGEETSDNESDGRRSRQSSASPCSETPAGSAQGDNHAESDVSVSPGPNSTANSPVGSPKGDSTSYMNSGDRHQFTPSPASSTNRDSEVEQAIQKILSESSGTGRGSVVGRFSPELPASQNVQGATTSARSTPTEQLSGQHSPYTPASSVLDDRGTSVSSPSFSSQLGFSPVPMEEPAPRVKTLVQLAAIAAGVTPPGEAAKQDIHVDSAVLPTALPEGTAETSESAQETMPVGGEPGQAKVNSGWLIVDSIRIPYVIHGGKPYVPVKIVEKQLLSSYPSKYPDELKGKPPLASRFVAASEAQQLMHMYSNSSDSVLKFSSKDLLVEYGEFNQFYSIIKKHFPNIKPKPVPATPASTPKDSAVYGGWLQINNTVIPYIMRARQKYVPLQVLKFAAGLKTDRAVSEDEPTEEECTHLNHSCKKAGLKFSFPHKETRLVSLLAVRQICQQTNTKISMLELPRENPLAYARYNTTVNANVQQNAMRMAGPRGMRMPGMPNAMGAMRGMRPGMRAPYGRGYGYPMQGGYRYPMPIRTINPRGSSKKDDSEVAVLHHVQRIEFKGKIITCLVRASDKEKFALVEAVGKLYFPEWELFDFQGALVNALRIPIYELTSEEEQAFISSYGLPIKHLNCRKAVQLRELDRFMPQLRYMFAGKKQMAANRVSPGKRQGGQVVGGSPFKRAVPPGYRPQMRMPYPVGMATASPPRQAAPRPVARPPRRRPKHDGTIITIDDDD